MLDKDIFRKKIEELAISYPNWKLDITDKKIIKTWYKHFDHFDDKDFIQAIDSYIGNERFNPTIAGIKEYIKNDNVTVI